MSSLRDQLLKTASGYIDGFNNPGPDMAGVIAYRTQDCLQRFLPASLSAPPQTNNEYVAYSRSLRNILRNFKLALSDGMAPVVDEEARKVLLPLRSTADMDFGAYANEYFIVLGMTADGAQIEEITEFLDSHYTLGFLQLVGMATLAGGGQ